MYVVDIFLKNERIKQYWDYHGFTDGNSDIYQNNKFSIQKYKNCELVDDYNPFCAYIHSKLIINCHTVEEYEIEKYYFSITVVFEEYKILLCSDGHISYSTVPNSIIHNAFGPAVIESDGSQHWYINGKPGRFDTSLHTSVNFTHNYLTFTKDNGEQYSCMVLSEELEDYFFIHQPVVMKLPTIII